MSAYVVLCLSPSSVVVTWFVTGSVVSGHVLTGGMPGMSRADPIFERARIQARPKLG